MSEPEVVNPGNWPTPYDENQAAPLRAALRHILAACIEFATAAG
jgi:formiminoglutamase